MSRYFIIFVLAGCTAGQTGPPADVLPPGDPKLVAITAVYDKLSDSSGQIKDFPALVVSRGRPDDPGALAYYENGGAIHFSEHLYDLCSKIAGARNGVPDCLSTLLGHELAHFLHQDDWATDVLPKNGKPHWDASLPQSASTQQIDASRRGKEAQADYDSGIYALQAGFDPTQFGPQLLDELYAEYSKNLQGVTSYPSLKERVEILKGSYRELTEELYPAFESGVRLFVLGEYDLAADCFAFVGRKFSSPEIFNNEAAAHILQGMVWDHSKSGGYLYPVELDLETRLNPQRGVTRGADDEFAAASKALRKAMTLDPAYAPGLLNQAILASLLDRPSEAKARLDDLAKIKGPRAGQYASDAAILQAILMARGGNKDGAARILTSLANQNNLRAKLNLQVLKDGAIEQKTVLTRAKNTEKVGETDLSSNRGPAHRLIVIHGSPGGYDDPIWLSADLAADHREYIVIRNGSRLVTLLTTPAAYPGTLLGKFRLGGSVQEILQSHPCARSFTAPQGTFYLLADDGILLLSNNGGKLINWTLFQTPGMN